MGFANNPVGAVALMVALGCSGPAAEENPTANEWLFQREMKRAQAGDIEAQARIGLFLEEGPRHSRRARRGRTLVPPRGGAGFESRHLGSCLAVPHRERGERKTSMKP